MFCLVDVQRFKLPMGAVLAEQFHARITPNNAMGLSRKEWLWSANGAEVYMRAQSIEEAGSLEAAVATIASRDYRKVINTLKEQIAKAEASHASLS
jgi:hypothetical protein